jgi:hypothetical protein
MTAPTILTVRLAHADDESGVLRLLAEAYAGDVRLDIERAKQAMAQAFERRGAVVGVIGPRDDIAAVCVLRIGQHSFTNGFYIEVLALHVRSDCGNDGHVEVLDRFIDKCAAEIGLPIFALGAKSDIVAAPSAGEIGETDVPEPDTAAAVLNGTELQETAQVEGLGCSQ